MEKRIYGENFKIILDDKNKVIWGYGQIPFNLYKPHEQLKYYQRGRDHWFSITTDFYPIDFAESKRLKENGLMSKNIDWILSAYKSGFIF